MSAKELTQAVRRFLDSTGEQSLLVLFEDDEAQLTGIHRIGWTAQVGLLVDGQPAPLGFIQQIQVFRPLQEPPALLH
jgi:hypothetical protein